MAIPSSRPPREDVPGIGWAPVDGRVVLSMPEPGQVPCSSSAHVRPANARRGVQGRGWQALRIAAAASCVAALLCVATGIVGSGRGGEPATWAAWSGATKTELLVWDPQYFEDEVPAEHNVFAGRKSVNAMIRDQSIYEATDVGRRVQDHDDVGLVLGQAAHVAFATIVELKRSMRGVERGELNMNVQSKIEVAETMLREAVKHLGITTVPPPPSDTRLSSLRSAMRLGRILRMMLARMPVGSDAHDFRETRFNLAVYDLDQVSRQLSNILLGLAETHEYEGLREPAFSNFDLAKRDADNGLAETKRIFGTEYGGDWNHVYKESRWNLLPKWQRREEERQGMKRYSGDFRVSDRHRSAAHAMDKAFVPDVARPVVADEVAPEEQAPVEQAPKAEEYVAPREKEAEEEGGEDPVVEEAIEGAISQDAKEEHAGKGVQEEMAERRIESTAVESVMEQAERAHESEKRSGHSRLAQVSGGESLVQLSGLRALNKAAGEASLFHRAAEQSLALVKSAAHARMSRKARALLAPARLQLLNAVTVPHGDRDLEAATHRDSAGVNHAVAMENSGDKFDSSSEPDADGGFGGVRNSEFADEKGDGLPYNLELEKDAVFESATAGMAMEVAHPEWEDSVEDATRIAVDAAIRAHEYTGAKGLQDVEEAAVEGATQSAKEMELRADEEHNPDRAYAMRAIAQRVENAAVKSAILAADAVADAHTPHAHKAVLVRPLATAQPVAVVRPLLGGAPAASYSAGPGVVAAGGAGTGAQFVPDATQSVPGMVTGTVYMPPSV